MFVRAKKPFTVAPDSLRVISLAEGDVVHVPDAAGHILVQQDIAEEVTDIPEEERLHIPGFGSMPARVAGEPELDVSKAREGLGARRHEPVPEHAMRNAFGRVRNAAEAVAREPLLTAGGDPAAAGVSERFLSALAQLREAVVTLSKATPMAGEGTVVAPDPGAVTRGQETRYRQPAEYDAGSFVAPDIPPRAPGLPNEPGGLQTAANTATSPVGIAQTGGQLQTEEPVPGSAEPTLQRQATPTPPEEEAAKAAAEEAEKQEEERKALRKARGAAPQNKSK